jgi:chromosome segregation ATPase
MTSRQPLTWTASAEVATHSPERVRAELLDALTGLGAYVQSSQDLSLDLRMPAATFEQAMHLLRYRADTAQHSTRSQDVALELSNLQARLKALTESRDRLRGMLALSTTVADTLLIERDLNQVTQEIESAQGQLRGLDHRLRWVPLQLTITRRSHDRPRLQRNNPFTWVSGYGPRSLLQESH